jgi:hypothetical protein
MPSAGTASPPRRDGIASRACSRPTPHPSSEGRSGGLAPGRTSHPSSEEQRKRTRWGLEHRSRLAHQRKLFGAQRAHRQAPWRFFEHLMPRRHGPGRTGAKTPSGADATMQQADGSSEPDAHGRLLGAGRVNGTTQSSLERNQKPKGASSDLFAATRRGQQRTHW